MSLKERKKNPLFLIIHWNTVEEKTMKNAYNAWPTCHTKPNLGFSTSLEEKLRNSLTLTSFWFVFRYSSDAYNAWPACQTKPEPDKPSISSGQPSNSTQSTVRAFWKIYPKNNLITSKTCVKKSSVVVLAWWLTSLELWSLFWGGL